MACKEDANGNLIGDCMDPFEYTAKKMVSIPEFRKLDITEFARVEEKGQHEDWVLTTRGEGVYY